MRKCIDRVPTVPPFLSLSTRGHAGSRGRPAGAALGALVALAVSASVLLAAVGPAVAGATTARKKHSGKVVVASAGSLEEIMNTAVEPAFHKATGDTVTDVSGGSTGLAQEIKGGVHRVDVFWSASPTSDKALMGRKNGGWVRWYFTFATTSLVLGYEPTDKFAAAIESHPWWRVITKPGFSVGRTNPVTDPKGRLIVDALKKSARQHSDSALRAIATEQTTVFTETSLVGRLQSGQLNAGFFYAVEASAAHFPTVPLTGVSEKADYTVAVVSKARHRTAANAFVTWLLSRSAKKLLKKYGLVERHKATLTGKKAAVPTHLKRDVRHKVRWHEAARHEAARHKAARHKAARHRATRHRATRHRATRHKGAKR